MAILDNDGNRLLAKVGFMLESVPILMSLIMSVHDIVV